MKIAETVKVFLMHFIPWTVIIYLCLFVVIVLLSAGRVLMQLLGISVITFLHVLLGAVVVSIPLAVNDTL